MNVPIKSFEEWLKSKNLKERTIKEYLYYFNKFSIYPGFTQETVSRFMAEPGNRNGIARSFIINFKKFIVINYKEFGMNDQTKLNAAEIELPTLTGRRKQRIINPIPHNQIPLLEQALDTEQEKLQLLASYYGALRLGEMLKMRVIDFNWEEWKENPDQMGECRVYGKGDKEGIAFFPGWLMKRFARYLRGRSFNAVSDYIFIRNVNLKSLNLKNRGRVWQKKLKEVGIKAGLTKLDNEGNIIQGTEVHPHRLRHSFATHLKIDKGLEISEIKEILRHSSIQSTQIYTHIDKNYLKKRLMETSVSSGNI